MEEILGWLAVLGAGAWAGVKELRRRAESRRVRRELRAVPAIEAGTPEGEQVKVTGVVRAIDPLIAPLSGRPCVLFRARAMIPVPRGSSYPAPLGEQVESMELTAFMLERAGETPVLVDGSHAILDLATLTADAIVPERCEKFLMNRGLTLRAASSAKFEETIVEAGMTITVIGSMLHDVALEPSADERDFRADHTPTLRLTGNAEHPLAIAAG